MTRDEILIAMKEVGAAKHDLMPKTYEGVVDVFERFAAIVRADERIRFADKCIDIVAFNGGSVEIEADIRSLAET